MNHYRYKQEQLATLKAIANTPFGEIAAILRNTVTASKRVELLSFLEKLVKSNLLESPDEVKKINEILKKPESFPKVSEIEDTIQLLEKRHRRYVTLK